MLPTLSPALPEAPDRGVPVRAVEAMAHGPKEEDRIDRWEYYERGAVARATEDADGDGRPDRRLTYRTDGRLLSLESEPDASGVYQRRHDVAGDPRR
jgi:hypothetical protein